MKRNCINCIMLISAAAILLSASIPVYADNGSKASDNTELTVQTVAAVSYDKYISEASDIAYGQTITCNNSNILSLADSEISDNINSSGEAGVVISDIGSVIWQINVPKTAKYIMKVRYSAAEIAGGNMDLMLKIDGEVPFKEASTVSFCRTYSQSTEDFKTNISGNDIKPTVTQELVWNETAVSDSSGYIAEPFSFVFSSGTHTISFEGSRGKIAISEIVLCPYEKAVSYADYISEHKNIGNVSADSAQILEGEKFSFKNSVTVLPSTDRTSPSTSPQSSKALKLNTVGGDNWKTVGDSITWEFDVKESGMYSIALRYRQNIKDGIFTSRKLLIDGALPFAEAASIRFNYNSSWVCDYIGNDDGAFEFYLEKGTHTLTLEAVAGDASDIIKMVDKSITSLNNIYRRIAMITGNSPDTNRDYSFDKLIPNEIDEMKTIKDDLQKSVDYINKQAGANGSYVSIIQKVIFQLAQMTENPRNIAKYLTRFKSNLGSMGEWLLSATEQPLEIDKIYINSPEKELEDSEVGFFSRLVFSVKCFLSSYITDYNSIGQTEQDGSGDNQLKVWIQTGRDQGEIVRQLIDTSFSKQNNAKVTLQIVSGGLLQSVLAGISPDVVMDNTDPQPIDYALRNAVEDLTQFSDYKEVSAWFSPAALKPACFNGAVYGMPQTFDFFMFFYRTDIFEEYGYKVPTTWKDLTDMIPSLQRNGFEVGVPHDENMFATFLYQYGGELYRDGGRYNNLDDEISVNAFVDFTELFTLYDCPVSYDFANRFRSGEMPCAIALYSQYNQLTAFAPEIKGMWKMVPIPGTKNSDGTINNVSAGKVTFIMLMKTCRNKQLAWDFMKWYMSNENQTEYAIQMESILGTCAKVTTANISALSDMTWSSAEYKNLFAQLKNVDSIPQVPGGYYLSRMISFAYNRVYNNSEDPSEVLTDYVKDLNDEIARKREEFGLE